MIMSRVATILPIMIKCMATSNYGRKDFRKYGTKETRTFEGTEKTLMTEDEKSRAQILELLYDFSCRIIRLYKFLNKGNLSKADRDVVGVLGLQMLRSGTSINANIAEA